MRDEAILVAIEAGLLLGLGLLCALAGPKQFRPVWFAGAILVFVLNQFLVTRGFWMVPDPLPGDLRWNWTGKVAATLGTLLVASLPMIGWTRPGLVLRQAPGAWTAWAVFALLGAVFVYLATLDGIAQSSAETIAFQWTMPGIEEETFYRGVLLLMLNEAFRGRVRILGAPLGWAAVLTSLLFGAVHGISVENGTPDFAFLSVWPQTVSGFVLVWMRERSGSVLLPILAHNFGNGIFTVI